MGRLETVGLDDQDHLAVLGALTAQSMRSMGSLQIAKPSWLTPGVPQGISQPAEELDYLPLDGVDFTNGGAGTVPVEDRLVAFPQRPFRGERLVLTCIYLAAGAAPADQLFGLIITPAIYVGAVQVGATQGQMPGIAFSATAFGVRLSMPTAGQGTRIFVPFLFPAVAAGDRLVVAGGIFGRAVR